MRERRYSCIRINEKNFKDLYAMLLVGGDAIIVWGV